MLDMFGAADAQELEYRFITLKRESRLVAYSYTRYQCLHRESEGDLIGDLLSCDMIRYT